MSGRLSLLFLAFLLAAAPARARDVLPIDRPAGEVHAAPRHDFRALVFSRTEGYRHASIPAGIAAVQALGREHDFQVIATEDPARITPDSLASYDVVIFLNTTGDVLDAGQQDALEAFVRSGGGFVGIHSAADTEYDWPFYGQLVGAWFDSHPPGTPTATVRVLDRVHPSTEGLPVSWQRTDEWYNYRTNPRGDVHVLATLDESTYSGGTMGADHPIAWCRSVDGGRSWYTAGGHTSAAFDEPLFRAHLLGGIEYAAGVVTGDCSATVGENIERVILDSRVDNPMSLEVAPDGRIFFIERTGRLRIHHPETGLTTTAGTLDVVTANEDGLLGLALDPAFADNGRLYLFYSPAGPEPIQRVSRFRMDGDDLAAASESVVLEIPVQREQCCHSAGSLAFGPDGNLFIATGDNTNPFESGGYAPIDERAGRGPWDAQKSSGNTADLRGKILRIRPLEEGGYAIPDGNLFADPKNGRPEIYVMGLRNPFRFSIDPQTGWLYWGDVGPDASSDDPTRGPRGYDEWNQARAAGNYGWPYCIADNQPYRDYDFATGDSGPHFDCSTPENDSPNNDGAARLPPAEPAWIWYPYGASVEFPSIPSGSGRTAMAGPVYRYDAESADSGALPPYYDGSVFIYEWARNWIREVKLDEEGRPAAILPFAEHLDFLRPIDLKVGPDGALYLLEWGSGFSGNNQDARLSRLQFERGIQGPVLAAEASPLSGPAPLTVSFSAVGTYHPDAGQTLGYAWDFTSDGTTDATGIQASHTYEAGTWTATLAVSDEPGNVARTTFSIVAGNSAPTVTLHEPASGGFFEWGEGVPFRISVSDPEDGSTENGSIDCGKVSLQLYLGHDEHAHPLDTLTGCSGTFSVAEEDHGGEGDRLFFVVEAAYTDGGSDAAGAITRTDEHLLQPMRIEAEHYSDHQGIRLETSADRLGGGQNIAYIDHGDYVRYDNVDLAGIDALTFRVASAGTGGSISVRMDDPKAEELARAIVVPTGGWQDYVDVTVPIDGEAAGAGSLFLVFEHDPGTTGLLNVNWIDFHGSGVHRDLPERGFRAWYFDTLDFSGPPVVRTDAQISFHYGTEPPAAGIAPTTYATRWLGTLEVATTAFYRFYGISDDAMRVWLDGELLIDDWDLTDGLSEIQSSTVALEGGSTHRLRVEYVNVGGSGTARLEWQSAAVPRSTVPFHLLTPAAEDTRVQETAPADVRSRLESPFPHPAVGTTSVVLHLAGAGAVRVALVDLLGREVRRVVDGWRNAGTHRVGVDVSGLASGLYTISVSAAGEALQAQLVVAR